MVSENIASTSPYTHQSTMRFHTIALRAFYLLTLYILCNVPREVTSVTKTLSGTLVSLTPHKPLDDAIPLLPQVPAELPDTGVIP